MIYGNSYQQDAIRQILRTQFRTMSLVGPYHLGKFSFIYSELQKTLSDDDILVAEDSTDGVRNAIEFSTMFPFASPFRAVIIDNVHLISYNAKDAYLKLCEEPPETCRLFLTMSDDGFLPESLRSRIQHRFFWSPLSKDEMVKFGEESKTDAEIVAMCGGFPGFCILFKKQEYKSFKCYMDKLLNESCSILLPIPELIQDLKPGASIERDAVAFIINQCIRNMVNDKVDVLRKPLVRSLIQFSANLTKYNSIDPEVHWRRAIVTSLL